MRIHPFLWLALSFWGYFCAYGVFMPLFPVWLTSQHYGAETIGMLLAFCYLFRFLGGIYFSGLIKKVSQLPNALRLFALASVFLMIFIGITVQHFWCLFIGVALFSMVSSAGMSLGDTLATTWQRQIQLDYGRVRLIGSMAFVCGVTVFGYLAGVIGEQYIIWILTCLLLVYVLLQLAQPNIPPLDEVTHQQQPQAGFIALLKNPTHLRLLLAASFIQGSHAVYYGYSVIYWTQLGFSVQTSSMLWGMSVVAEVILFFFSAKLFKHWKLSYLFYFATSATCLRWLLFTQATDLWAVAILQCFHCLSYALTHYSIMRYITVQPAHTMAKLQGLYNALANCAAVALLSVFAGLVYPISADWAFWGMALVASLALLIIPPKLTAFLVK